MLFLKRQRRALRRSNNPALRREAELPNRRLWKLVAGEKRRRGRPTDSVSAQLVKDVCAFAKRRFKDAGCWPPEGEWKYLRYLVGRRKRFSFSMEQARKLVVTADMLHGGKLTHEGRALLDRILLSRIPEGYEDCADLILTMYKDILITTPWRGWHPLRKQHLLNIREDGSGRWRFYLGARKAEL